MLLKAGIKLENAINENNCLKAIVAEHERLAEEYKNKSDSGIFEKIDQFTEIERRDCIKRIDVQELIVERDKLRAQVDEYKQLVSENKNNADLVMERDNLKARVSKYEEKLNKKYVMSE